MKTEAFAVQITKKDGGKLIHGKYKDKAAADKFVKFISNIPTNNKGNKKFKNIGGFGSITDIPQNIKNPKK